MRQTGARGGRGTPRDGGGCLCSATEGQGIRRRGRSVHRNAGTLAGVGQGPFGSVQRGSTAGPQQGAREDRQEDTSASRGLDARRGGERHLVLVQKVADIGHLNATMSTRRTKGRHLALVDPANDRGRAHLQELTDLMGGQQRVVIKTRKNIKIAFTETSTGV